MKLKFLLFLSIFFMLSCDDDGDLMPLEAMIVTNLYTPEYIGNGPNQQLANFIKANIYGKKIVIGMGAGTISSWMRELPKLLS